MARPLYWVFFYSHQNQLFPKWADKSVYARLWQFWSVLGNFCHFRDSPIVQSCKLQGTIFCQRLDFSCQQEWQPLKRNFVAIIFGWAQLLHKLYKKSEIHEDIIKIIIKNINSVMSARQNQWFFERRIAVYASGNWHENKTAGMIFVNFTI